MQAITRGVCLLSSSLRGIRSASRCTCSYSQSIIERISSRQQRSYSAEAQLAPILECVEKEYHPKIQEIVSDISQLTLLEVADLNELLKKTLKITDAPMMAMGAAASVAAVDEAPEEAPVKSLFTVRLIKFDIAKKVALIKQMKVLIEGMNLVQAKKFVESAPTDVKTDLTQENADEIKKSIEAAGGTVELV